MAKTLEHESRLAIIAAIARNIAMQKSVQQEYPDITRIYFASESIAHQQRHADSSATD